MDIITKRSEKLAFYQTGSGFKRMRGFTDFTMNKNPKEYTRKYVDEKNERNDVVGYNPTISFSFDKFSTDEVHKDIVEIADTEAVGTDAVRTIIIVDTGTQMGEGSAAQKRDFTVIPDSEGNDTDAYTYSGTLKSNGDITYGYASSNDDWQTVTFNEL